MDHDIDIRSEVEVAVATAMEAPDKILSAMYEAVYAYHDNGDPAVLIEFAEAARLTALVHASPGYAEALQNAPTRPGLPGRSLRDIFAERLA
jgi:hypothetical protein